MKSARCILFVALLSLSTAALAQSDAKKIDTPKTDAQESFELLKSMAGSWEGPVKVDPPQPDMKSTKPVQLSLRVTSMGNLLVHEMRSPDRPDDPITTIYLDEGKLTLTHYCDAGNRPRMVARPSADGKSVEFDFVDIAGNTQYGHMHHAVFTAIDENNHIEEWTFIINGKNGEIPIHAHFDLTRKKLAEVASR
jgi:hypothetical protein